MFHSAFGRRLLMSSVEVNGSLSSIFMLDLALLHEEPVVMCLQALGRPVSGELPKACLVSQVSKCKSRQAYFCRTAQPLTGKTYNKHPPPFNSFLWSNEILAFGDSVKKCSIFFSLVHVCPCYLPTSSPCSYDAS